MPRHCEAPTIPAGFMTYRTPQNMNPYYWMWGVNRWLSIRFNLLSCGIVGAMAVLAVWNPAISASVAGFSLAFATTITHDLLFMVSIIPYALFKYSFVIGAEVRWFGTIDGKLSYYPLA